MSDKKSILVRVKEVGIQAAFREKYPRAITPTGQVNHHSIKKLAQRGPYDSQHF